MKGGYRANAGRSGWRRKIERTLSLDIRELARLGCLRPGADPLGWHWLHLQTRTESVDLGVQPRAERLELSYRLNSPNLEKGAMGGEWRRESILLDHTPCHYGGCRPWFRCPYCEHRRALLYLSTNRGGGSFHCSFRCRTCAQLAHTVEAEGAIGRMWRKQKKLMARLATADRSDPNPPRPKGMHEHTYRGLLERIWAIEAWGDEQLYRCAMGL